MAYDPLNLKMNIPAQRNVFTAMRNVNAMQAGLDHASALNKSGSGSGRGGAIEALAVLAGVGQPNSVADEVVGKVVEGLFACLAKAITRATDTVLVAGTPPLTRSMVDRAASFFAKSLDVKLRSFETKILEALITDVWKRGVQEEIASIVALLVHAGSNDPKDSDPATVQTVAGQFLGLAWSEPFLLWAQAVCLRSQSIGESIDPELQSAINESDRLKKDNERLNRDLKQSKEKEAKTSQELQRTQSDLKAAVEQQGKLQRKLDQVFESPATAESGTLEQRLRVLLVQHAADGLFIDPHVPPKKIVNARLECKVPATEKVLALLDLTVFGSAKDAIILGLGGIYHHSGANRCAILYSEMVNLDIVRFETGLKFVTRNGTPAERVLSTLGSGYPLERFHSLVNAVAATCAQIG
ncbi:MAG TPA: hypothetical protein VKU19_22025 [Bryobacteraceae bacterium]|nr:hypothetical protein [Bryobacteraceae bacterium]